MEDRIVEFITGLRGAGVRVSVAESADALRALEHVSVGDKNTFRCTLQATLVKDHSDAATFEELFPMYFGSGEPPMQQPGGGDDSQMTEEEREKFQQMLEEMLANMTPEQLAELMRSMMTGEQPSRQQMREMMQGLNIPPMPGMRGMNSQYMQYRMAQRALDQLEFERLKDALQELLDQLREAGMSEEALQEIESKAQENMQALAEQIGQQVGRQMMEGQGEGERQRTEAELMDRPFERLTQDEVGDLRKVVQRLAARLRSRMALRQKRGKTGTLDAKNTIRRSMRYGGVPIEIRHRRRHLKPRLVVICDRSVSTERVVTFMLLLLYTLQDQISRTRSFAFIDHIHDMSTFFAELRPEQAIERVMETIRPTRSYSTDLGASLHEFMQDFGSTVDHRTTVIFLGDARNNENDPRLDMFGAIKKRARRVIWFNTEPKHMWGRYDPGSLSSDMLEYAPMCDAVHEVCNLRQLADAVDSLFVRR